MSKRAAVDVINTAFAQNASADERAVLAAVQRPISQDCITVPVGRLPWKDIPSWFLIAEDDRMIMSENQRYGGSTHEGDDQITRR